MTQSELHRALARATGESPSVIRRMGFTLLARPSRRRGKRTRRAGLPQAATYATLLARAARTA